MDAQDMDMADGLDMAGTVVAPDMVRGLDTPAERDPVMVVEHGPEAVTVAERVLAAAVADSTVVAVVATQVVADTAAVTGKLFA
jgi:hypothetical protein